MSTLVPDDKRVPRGARRGIGRSLHRDWGGTNTRSKPPAGRIRIAARSAQCRGERVTSRYPFAAVSQGSLVSTGADGASLIFTRAQGLAAHLRGSGHPFAGRRDRNDAVDGRSSGRYPNESPHFERSKLGRFCGQTGTDVCLNVGVPRKSAKAVVPFARGVTLWLRFLFVT